MNFFLVASGGAIGSLLRYAISLWISPKPNMFPYATFWANALSCLILGIAIALFTKNYLSEQWRLFIVTGICGGFSTFSTFTNDTFLLFHHGNYILCIMNIILNMIICMFCLTLGVNLIERL